MYRPSTSQGSYFLSTSTNRTFRLTSPNYTKLPSEYYFMMGGRPVPIV